MKQIYNIITCTALTLAITLVCAICATAQVQTLPTMKVAGRVLRYYDVKRGDNIYTVAEKLGLSRDEIVDNNPSAADGLTPGMRLYFPGDITSSLPAAPAPGSTSQPLTHVVQKGESVYGIAAIYNIPVERIIKLNPQADTGISAGQVLVLDDSATALPANPSTKPTPSAPTATPTPSSTNEITLADFIRKSEEASKVNLSEAESTSEEEDTPVSPSYSSYQSNPSYSSPTFQEPPEALPDEMSVAVVLPFMAADQRPARAAQLNQEFLRGMLMAADELSSRPGARVYIRAFDTKGNPDTLRSLMEQPRVSGADIIIVPDADGQMAFIEKSDTRSYLLNYFSVKDETYRDHHNVIQANIPHHDMYEVAIDGFMEKYRNGGQQYYPVFLERQDGNTDKDEFVAALKNRLDKEGVLYNTITFEQNLSEDDLLGYNPDVQPVVYIPLSGLRSEFSRFTPALLQQKGNLLYPDAMALWGYPEWVTFRGENRETLGRLNTTIYSRFFADDSDTDIKQLRDRYRHWYGEEMSEAFPMQGILGYDAGTFIINALRAMADGESLPAEFEGVQNTLRLERASDAENAGFVNHSLYLIHYLPGMIVEKTRL